MFSPSAKLFFASIIAIPATVVACTVVYPHVEVGPTFRVRVEDGSRPVEGLRVGVGARLATTDKNGFAVFSAVRPGLYHLSVDRDAGIPDGVDLEVKPNGPTDVTVALRWPVRPPILVRSLKGKIRGSDYVPGQPQPRLSLDLIEGKTGRTLESAQTNEKGAFNFENTAPGLYFLSLKPSDLRGWSGEQITGLILVTIDQSAAAENLDLSLGWTSCGLYYADQSQCAQEFQTEMLSGRVIDPTGAIIPGAKILLLGPAGAVVDQLQSDRDGKFASSLPLAGTFEFVVSMAGLAPFRARVQVGPTAELARRSLLTIQLDIGGSCGSFDLR